MGSDILSLSKEYDASVLALSTALDIMSHAVGTPRFTDAFREVQHASKWNKRVRAAIEERQQAPKLVGELLRELAEDVPNKPGFESVRADLLAASKVYEYGKKQDMALRFYLAIRSLFHELERLDISRGQPTNGG
jgi:hypothetical protein